MGPYLWLFDPAKRIAPNQLMSARPIEVGLSDYLNLVPLGAGREALTQTQPPPGLLGYPLQERWLEALEEIGPWFVLLGSRLLAPGGTENGISEAQADPPAHTDTSRSRAGRAEISGNSARVCAH